MSTIILSRKLLTFQGVSHNSFGNLKQKQPCIIIVTLNVVPMSNICRAPNSLQPINKYAASALCLIGHSIRLVCISYVTSLGLSVTSQCLHFCTLNISSSSMICVQFFYRCGCIRSLSHCERALGGAAARQLCSRRSAVAVRQRALNHVATPRPVNQKLSYVKSMDIT